MSPAFVPWWPFILQKEARVPSISYHEKDSSCELKTPSKRALAKGARRAKNAKKDEFVGVDESD
jgi:hypothetical protein